MQEIEKVRLSEIWPFLVRNLIALFVQPLKSANMHEVVPEWDANFVDIEQELLFELILVSQAL
jgi:hypothetical protein